MQTGTVGCRFATDVAGLVAAFVRIGQTVRRLGQTLVQILMKSLVLPVGSDEIFNHFGVLLGHLERCGRVEGKLLERRGLVIPVKLRVQDAVARTLMPQTPHNELIVVDQDAHGFAHVLQGSCPAKNKRLAFAPHHGFREQFGALDVNVRLFSIKDADHPVHAGMPDLVGILDAGNTVENGLFLPGPG